MTGDLRLALWSGMFSPSSRHPQPPLQSSNVTNSDEYRTLLALVQQDLRQIDSELDAGRITDNIAGDATDQLEEYNLFCIAACRPLIDNLALKSV